MSNNPLSVFKSPGVYTREETGSFVPPVGATPKMIELLNLIMEDQGLTYEELWEVREVDSKMNKLIREVKIKKLLEDDE